MGAEKEYVHEKHGNVVDEIRRSAPSEEEFMDLADLFKVFGDSSRIKILCALFERELSVCCIADAAGISQSAASHQLRVLKANHLVSYRKEGKEVYYRLADDHVHEIYKMGLEHIREGREA